MPRFPSVASLIAASFALVPFSVRAQSCSWTAVLDLAVSNVGVTQGVAWVDYDNDGDLDLHFTKAPGSGGNESRLVRNDGNDSFVHISGSALATLGDDRAPTWGDYDNDGDPDCYVASSGPNHLFRNEGDGTFTDVTTPGLDRQTGGACAWADYDNDGDLDLYVGGDLTSSNALFRNDSGTFVDVTVPPLDLVAATQSVAWADYDNDNDQDIYVSANGAQNRLFRNDGGVFVNATAAPLDDRGGGHAAAWADYDNDGFQDLYLVNIATTNKLFHNNGDGTFEDVSQFPLNDVTLNVACAWGDYDNDGFEDLYFDRAFASNVLLHNDLVYGEFHFSDRTAGPLFHLPIGGGLAWGDYDGDGDLDLVMATIQNDQPNLLVRNDCPPATNWLQVDLRGVTSNRDGIGAKLRVVEANAVQYRWVASSSGLSSQNSRTAEFGFGLASKTPGVIDTLEVTWPSGTVQRISGIAVNQKIVVMEDSTTVGIDVSGFRAVAEARRVDLEWYVSQDYRGDGFSVHRSPTRNGPWRRLNDAPIRMRNPNRWTDREVEPLARYFYRLDGTDEAGRPVELELLSVRTPFWGAHTTELERNRPNPFVRSTELGFSLKEPGTARLTVHDVAGRRLATVVSGSFPAGRQAVLWDGSDDRGQRLPAGVYFYRLEAADASRTRRLVLLGR